MADGTIGSQTTLLSTISLPELTDLVRRNWIWSQENIVANAKQLFTVDNVGSGQGSSKRFNEIDVETYADYKAEGTDSTKAKVGVGYSMDMTARTYSKELDITLEMRNDNRYPEVGAFIMNLANFCENRLDLALTHVFTFAGSTSYTDRNGQTINGEVGDGLALISAVHTLAFSSTTYSNVVPGNPAFSEAALEAAMLIANTNTYSNFGEKRNMRYDTIVSGDDPFTVRTIQQVIRSTADPEAVQSGIVNVYNGKFKHVILPNLATDANGAYDSTKRRWWFLMASGSGMLGFQGRYGSWIAPTLLTPSDTNSGMDIHNYNWTYSAYCRFGVAAISPKGIIGSLVSS